MTSFSKTPWSWRESVVPAGEAERTASIAVVTSNPPARRHLHSDFSLEWWWWWWWCHPPGIPGYMSLIGGSWCSVHIPSGWYALYGIESANFLPMCGCWVGPRQKPTAAIYDGRVVGFQASNRSLLPSFAIPGDRDGSTFTRADSHRPSRRNHIKARLPA